jgi:hypothetical protein
MVDTFRTFTGDLHRLVDWLDKVKVTTVAMSSTGIYCVPFFELLETRGFEVLSVTARNEENVPGRKTDISNA